MNIRHLAIAAALALGASEGADAAIGCDINLRINNKTPGSIVIFGDERSGASKAGLKLWKPISGLEDATLDPEGSGAGSHTNQAVELGLPCWTGKVDFRIKYLDGNVERWKYRYGVEVESGKTVNINIP
jgi:hypothetical protein